MISAKRIASIFCKKGGSGEFTKMAHELNPSQLSVILDDLGDETPLIASVRSRNEWFAITDAHFFQRHLSEKRSVRLDQVDDVVGDRPFALAKRQGGALEIRLRDKSTLSIELESGGPYFAVMNVFLSLARVNRKFASVGQRPTTDD